MNDGVSARVLLVSHCLLNPFSQVKGYRSPKQTASYAISQALQHEVGLIQLPCPEFTFEGPNRWAKSFEQYDHRFFRRHCQEILDPLLEQLRAYFADGTELVGVIGVQGSPSCGVFEVGSAPEWGGCFVDGPEGEPWQAPESKRVWGRGVFLDELAQALEDEGWEGPVIGVPSDQASSEVLSRYTETVAMMMARVTSGDSTSSTSDPTSEPPSESPSESDPQPSPDPSADPFVDGDLKDWA